MKRLALATVVVFALATTPLFAQTPTKCPPGKVLATNGQCVTLHAPSNTGNKKVVPKTSAAEREKAAKEKAAKDKAEKERVAANKAKAKEANCPPGTHVCGTHLSGEKICVPTSKSCSKYLAEKAENHNKQQELRLKKMKENRENKANK
jgi:hypothetical protein